MKISTLFPGNYLKAADLADGARILKIESVKLEKMGDGEHKPVINFVEEKQGLVGNKTNCNVLVALYGDDTSEWVGKKIQLIATTTEFGGRTVDCIRLRAPPVSDELKKAEFD
jgi:hypothetical protein